MKKLSLAIAAIDPIHTLPIVASEKRQQLVSALGH
jgi:hypothetical protein